ncbi:hypothetical protein GCM10010440_08970 [Kitasatospora cinereorecta]
MGGAPESPTPLPQLRLDDLLDLSRHLFRVPGGPAQVGPLHGLVQQRGADLVHGRHQQHVSNAGPARSQSTGRSCSVASTAMHGSASNTAGGRCSAGRIAEKSRIGSCPARSCGPRAADGMPYAGAPGP